MEKEKIEISKKDLDLLFDGQMKAYLSLEKNIYDLMGVYENEPTEGLKKILLNIISSAKNQIFVLLDMISRHYKGDIQVSYSNKIGEKLNSLHEIEEKLLSSRKML